HFEGMGHAERVGIAQKLIVHVTLELEIIEAVRARRCGELERPLHSRFDLRGADPQQSRHLRRSEKPAHRKIQVFVRNSLAQVCEAHPALPAANPAHGGRAPHEDFPRQGRAAPQRPQAPSTPAASTPPTSTTRSGTSPNSCPTTMPWT